MELVHQILTLILTIHYLFLQEWQDCPPDFDLVKVKVEPVDSVDANLQHPENIFTGNDIKAKDEDQIIDLSFSRAGSPVPSVESPRKRQRVIVLLPTLAEIRNRKKNNVNEEDVEKLKKLFKVCLRSGDIRTRLMSTLSLYSRRRRWSCHLMMKSSLADSSRLV